MKKDVKKILCITFEAPTVKYGGGMGIIQSLESISNEYLIDYVGPYFETKQFPQFNIDKTFFMKDCSILCNVINMLRGVSVRFYQEWKRYSKLLNLDDYECVFVDFSFNDYIVKWAAKKKIKTIVRVHNIEHDMSRNYVKTGHIDKYWIKHFVNGWIITLREKKCMKLADHLIFLTSSDKKRASDLYNLDLSMKSSIVPVCLTKKYYDKKAELNFKYVLSTGSLSYGANANGYKWFIKNVWAEIQKNESFKNIYYVLAGGNPDDELVGICENTPNCILIDSPKTMEPYFLGADLYIAPVFTGAGMKVKVAEALKYNLPVIGTEHAFIGYEEAEESLFEANTKEDMVEVLEKYQNGIIDIKSSSPQEVFMKLYSMERSKNCFKQIINNTII